MKFYSSIILMAVCLCTCVANGAQKNTNDFMEAEKKCYSAYQSEDINIAENALLVFESTILDYKKDAVTGIDYDSALKYVYARLYLINKQKGLMDKANDFINKSVKCFSRNQTFSQAEIEDGKKQIIGLINRLDSRLNVKWKNAQAQPQP